LLAQAQSNREPTKMKILGEKTIRMTRTEPKQNNNKVGLLSLLFLAGIRSKKTKVPFK